MALFTLKVSCSLNSFTSSVSHGVKNYFPWLWCTDILFYVIFQCIFNDFGFQVDITPKSNKWMVINVVYVGRTWQMKQ